MDVRKRKTTKGRQKIEINPIQVPTTRQVTFTKRRAGVISKASELCLLCGAQIAIITFSPGGHKVYTFGHPDVGAVLEKYLGEEKEEDCEEIEAHVFKSIKEYKLAEKVLEEEKKEAASIKEKHTENESIGKHWWDTVDIQKLGFEELEVYLKSLQDLKKNVGIRANDLIKSELRRIEQELDQDSDP